MRLAALFASVALAPAMSQVLPVRSGEHADFSRLVVPLGQSTEWLLERSDRSVSLTLPGGPDLSVDRVFDLIPRTRIRAVELVATDATQIRIRLGCACPVEAVAEGRNVIIDVSDPVEDPPSSPTASDDTGGEGLPRRPRPRPTRVASVEAMPTETDSVPGSPAATTHVEAARAELLRQLQRAEEMGFLRVDSGSQPVEAVDEPPSQPDPAPIMQAEAPEPEAPAPNCPSPQDLDLAGWTGGAPFDQQVADLRQRLSTELDGYDTGAALDLVRLYVSHGFGPEARQTLQLLPEEDRPQLLVELALLTDGEPVAPNGRLADAAACGGPAALLHGLAGGPLNAEHLPTFSTWPPALRAHFAPRLLARLRDDGRLDTAEQAMRLVERAPHEQSPAYRLEKARLLFDLGAPSEAKAMLEALIAEGDLLSPEALIALADHELSRADAPAEALADRLASERFAARGGPEAWALSRLEMMVRARLGDLSAVLNLADAVDRDALAGPAERARALAAALDALPNIDPAPDTLDRLLRRAQALPSDRSGDALRVAVARRLHAAGLAHAADDLIAGLDNPPVGWADLATATALARGDFATAIDRLPATTDPDVRAAALRAGSEFAAAADAYAAAGDLGAEAEAAWLAGAWDRASSLPDLRGTLADRRAEDASEGASTLDAARTALSESQQLSGALRARFGSNGDLPSDN